MKQPPSASATTALSAALRRTASRTGVTLEIIEASERAWASLTFSGARHRLVISAEDNPRTAAFFDALPDTEMPMHRHIAMEPEIVSAASVDGSLVVTVEVVTVEKD